MSHEWRKERERARAPKMTEISPPSETEFDRVRAVVRSSVGVELRETKRALVFQRLRKRLTELGIISWNVYLDLVESDPAEKDELIDRITTNETSFFRDVRQFEFLRDTVIPSLVAKGRRRVRAWSAACSTGEEAYSMAMVLDAGLPEGWDLRVEGTDVSPRVLEIARRAVWPLAEVEAVPEEYLRRYMLKGKGSKEGRATVTPELRRIVRFSRLNLLDLDVADEPRYDIVFCRNVLIYFAREQRPRLLTAICSRIHQDGTLFLGSSESASRPLERLSSNIYRMPSPVEVV